MPFKGWKASAETRRKMSAARQGKPRQYLVKDPKKVVLDGCDHSGGPDSCWIWKKSRYAGSGYGQLTHNKKPYRAHRFSWITFVGPIPDDQLVLHRCDNPSCVNPKHLFLGSYTDNMKDMNAKGRGNYPKGEKTGAAKMTEAGVLEARRKWKTGSYSVGALAKEYGITSVPMKALLTGRTWKHVGGL